MPLAPRRRGAPPGLRTALPDGGPSAIPQSFVQRAGRRRPSPFARAA